LIMLTVKDHATHVPVQEGQELLGSSDLVLERHQT